MSIMSLWMPILLSAVLVFIASSIIHMLLPYHRSDFKKVPDEDGVMDALRPFNIPPGEYLVPMAGSPAEMKSEAFKEKVRRGPMLFMGVMDSSKASSMGPQLAQWFVYCLVVGVFAAYLTSRTVSPDAEYLHVFRVAGTVAFTCYCVAGWQRSIWYQQRWSVTLKATFDALIYAMLTGGSFGSGWPW